VKRVAWKLSLPPAGGDRGPVSAAGPEGGAGAASITKREEEENQTGDGGRWPRRLAINGAGAKMSGGDIKAHLES
jgi:hypothetical protein